MYRKVQGQAEALQQLLAKQNRMKLGFRLLARPVMPAAHCQAGEWHLHIRQKCIWRAGGISQQKNGKLLEPYRNRHECKWLET